MGFLIYSMKFPPPEVALYLCITTIWHCMEHCWHTCAVAHSCYLDISDKQQTRICRTVGPSFTTSLEPFAHRCKVTSWNFSNSYYFAQCLSELVELIPHPYSCGRSTRTLIGCMVLLSPFLVIIKMSILTFTFLSQLGSEILGDIPCPFQEN